MRKDTKEALQKSIEHWERLARSEVVGPREEQRFTLDGEPFREEPYGDDCALCLYFDPEGAAVCERKVGKEIERCPVYARTGLRICEGTPWYKAREAFFGWIDGDRKAIMQEEVDFLKSLLPDDD